MTSTTIPPSDAGHWSVVGVTGLFVPFEWANNDNFDGAPSIIENIALDGNRTANPYSTCCGVVTQNFWTSVRRCLIQNMPASGVHQTDTTANGTSITSSSSENRILDNKILNCTLHGIRSTNALNTTNQDGFCQDNNISQVAGCGILFDRISGWKIQGNHLYNIGMNGIAGSNSYATKILDNEIEDFGNACAVGAFYQGITITQLDGRGSHVDGNFVGCLEPAQNAVGDYQYIAITAGSSQTDAHASCRGNILHGPASPTSKGLALVYQINGGGTLRVRSGENAVTNVNSVSFFQTPGAHVMVPDSQGREHSITSASTSAFNATNGNNAALVAGSNDLAGQISCGTPASVAAGQMCGVSFEQSFAAAPFVKLTPINAASAALNAYVTAVAGGSFTIAVVTAPAASQAAGTYGWTYSVLD